MTWTVAALYHFTPFDDPAGLRLPLLRACEQAGVVGTILLAPEGINGTIASDRQGIDTALTTIRALPGCADLVWKESDAQQQPFYRMKVRLKREIVTMGVDGVSPAARVGHYVKPADWNDFIVQDDVVMIDTRNDFEVSIGTFDGAIDPDTTSFGEFPAWWQANAHRFAGKRVGMFCTGGIRCEKATSWLVDQGHDNVFHLQGGILKYLEDVPAQDSQWQGQCFVFDERVSVGHGLEPGDYEMCRACRRPVSPADKRHVAYQRGVSCPRCIDEYTPADRARFAERQRQIDLAEQRGERHIGGHDTRVHATTDCDD
ncbi:MAG: rhodanese-related sulfurtransferase [Pseudomonadota bacterium]